MKILVLNASPKGKFSTTLQTALYLQALHPEDEFTFLPVGSASKAMKKIFPRCAMHSRMQRLYSFVTPFTRSLPPISCTA